MAEQLPDISVEAEGEERTYRVTLETDRSKPMTEWRLVFWREIVYTDKTTGEIVRQMRGGEVDSTKFPTYKHERSETVVTAESIDPGIVARIRNDIDTMIATQKAQEARG